jgi:hypothetical protein
MRDLRFETMIYIGTRGSGWKKAEAEKKEKEGPLRVEGGVVCYKPVDRVARRVVRNPQKN